MGWNYSKPYLLWFQFLRISHLLSLKFFFLFSAKNNCLRNLVYCSSCHIPRKLWRKYDSNGKNVDAELVLKKLTPMDFTIKLFSDYTTFLRLRNIFVSLNMLCTILGQRSSSTQAEHISFHIFSCVSCLARGQYWALLRRFNIVRVPG